jgi:hypothetical protein
MVRERINAGEIKHLSVFALDPIPLLVLLDRGTTSFHDSSKGSRRRVE